MSNLLRLLNTGFRELYHKPFSEVEHPRGDTENAGHFAKKGEAVAKPDADDPLQGLPSPKDVSDAASKANEFSHAGYRAKLLPGRGMADSWSVELRHPDGRVTEHDLEDRKGRATRAAAVKGIHGLLKSHLLAKAKPAPAASPPKPQATPDDRLAKLAERRDPDGISEQPVDKELRQAKEATPLAKPKGGGLFGDIELPKPEAWTPPRYKPGERPHGVRMMPGGLWTGPATLHKDDLSVDPSRFQYKIAGIDARTGVTRELKGVGKYNPLLGGQLLVWHDPADGKTYVVNGHHRAELAQRSTDWDSDESGPGWHGEMQAFYIPAKTAQEARAWGALANIAEGRGTATDAAKFMRDTGASADALKSRGISMSGRVTQDATDLSGLSDKTFQNLANGRMTENRALSIARHVKDHAMQDKLYDLIQQRERDDGEEVTDSEIAEVARALELAGTTKVKGGKAGGMLFGDDDEWDEPLLWQRAAVTSAIRRGLTTERNVFRAVSTDNRVRRISEVGENKLDVDANKSRAQSASEALYLFDRLANSKGELSELLHRHAERLFHAPHDRKRIVEDAKREAIDALGRAWGADAGAGDGGGDASREPAREGYSRPVAGRRGTDGEGSLPRRRSLRFLTLASALAPHAVGAIHYAKDDDMGTTDVKLEGVTETGSKISKVDAGYRPAPSAARCGRCEHFRAGRCASVAGEIDEFNTCALWRPGDGEKPQVYGVSQLEQYAKPFLDMQRMAEAINARIWQGFNIPAEMYAGRFAPGAGQLGLPFPGASKMAPGSGQLALPMSSGPHQWEESKHPRDHGKFSSAPGGTGSAQPLLPAPAAKPAAEPQQPFSLQREPAHVPAKPEAPAVATPSQHQTTLWHGMNDQPGQKKLFAGLDMGVKPKDSATQAPGSVQPKPAASVPDAAVAKAPEAAKASPIVPPDVKAAAGVAAPHTPPPPGRTYAPDPGAVGPSGIAQAARVGVPGNSVPPPPKEIPRLPNLTTEERRHEQAFASAFEANPEALVGDMLHLMSSGKLGDAPNIFATDEAKMLYPQWRGESTAGPDGKKVLTPETKQFRSTMNTALHQTANAVAKRAFLHYLDNVVSKLPEGNRHVLATAGGVASGKSFALSNIPHMNAMQQSAGAVWDAAGEQNSTELPWIADECAKRGIKLTAVYVHADPNEVWATPKGGVIERAGNKGRMVDARAFADSYTHGARNFHAFAQQHANNPMVATAVLTSPRGAGLKPSQIAAIPQEALATDPEALYAHCLQQLSTSPQATPAIKQGGAAGLRIWGPPGGVPANS